jgi:hypothetical protein
MTKNQEVAQEIMIEKFREKFFVKYGAIVNIMVETKQNYKLNLNVFVTCTLRALRKNEIEFENIKDLKVRTRKKEFVAYIQVMSYMAHKEKFTKTSIGIKIKRDHSTIISSIKKVEDGFYSKDKLILKAFNNIKKEIKNYVGNLPEDVKEQIIAKSSFSLIWDEAENCNTNKD